MRMCGMCVMCVVSCVYANCMCCDVFVYCVVDYNCVC